MCGIAGLFSTRSSPDPEFARKTVKAMTDAITHRGPDSDGLWQDAEHPGVVLGQRRLAILDLSPLGAQPMESHSGRYWCVYNGEIYNYQSIEAELKALGHSFRGRSDTEVVLAAIDQWGLNQTSQKIIGMYAFIIWDRKESVLHLMRDRLGKKPLYLGWAGADLVMGSELKALRAHPEFEKTVERNSLAQYMTYGYINAPLTIYKNVWTLPPGARMSLKLGELSPGQDLTKKIEYYWDLSRVVAQKSSQRSQKKDSDIIAEFDDLLRLCVRERMISDVPLGAFLSGGIDSSAVVALMQAQSGMPVKTYSIGFDVPSLDEAPYAADIAQHLGTDHHELYLSDRDALDVVPKLADMYDEPFADISQIPTYLVSKFARRDVTVALSGDGGDEMLGGYNRHRLVPKLWQRMKYTPAILRRFAADTIERRSDDPHQRKLAGSLRQSGPMAIYDYLLAANPGGSALVKDGYLPLTAVTDPSREVSGLTIAENLMFKDMLSYLPNDILVKVDRVAMAVSLEARAPLLDSRIAEYVWTLPLEMKIRNGQGKWLLRQVLEKYVPHNLTNRPKRGFTPPIDAWLRGGLKDWAAGLLSPEKIAQQGYLSPEPITKMWQDHQSGRNNGTQLWTVLMFQAWLDRGG